MTCSFDLHAVDVNNALPKVVAFMAELNCQGDC